MAHAWSFQDGRAASMFRDTGATQWRGDGPCCRTESGVGHGASSCAQAEVPFWWEPGQDGGRTNECRCCEWERDLGVGVPFKSLLISH